MFLIIPIKVYNISLETIIKGNTIFEKNYVKISLYSHKAQNIIIIFPKDYMEIMKSITNKMISGIVDKNKKQVWENYTNYLLPKNSLGYPSEEAFLKDKKLTREQVIKNSILFIYPKTDSERLNYLSQQFKILVKKHKIRINKKSKKAVYSEIIFILNYIKSIDALIKKYPQNWSNYYGTKFRSSSEQNLIKTQLNYLQECLDNPFFPVINKQERKKIKTQIKFLKEASKPENEGFSEIFNRSNSRLGINHKLMGFSKFEQNIIKQIISFYNGIRCKKEELVKSTKILMREISNIREDTDYQDLIDSIENIAYDFFDYVYKESKKKSESKDKRIRSQSAYKQLKFTIKQLSNESHVKTVIDDIEIFTYTHTNTFNFDKTMNLVVIKSIFGIQNMLEPNLPTLKDATKYHMLKHSLVFKKEMGFTKKELRYYIFTIWQVFQEQILLELGNTSN